MVEQFSYGSESTLDTAKSLAMKDPKTTAVNLIREAAEALLHAHSTLVAANGMAADVPAVKEVLAVSKGLTQIMSEVSKLRGL